MEVFFFFQAEDGIRDIGVTGVQTCALPIFGGHGHEVAVRLPARDDVDVDVAGEARAGDLPLVDADVEAVGPGGQIGRASCRERVEISVVAVSLKKKKSRKHVMCGYS